MAALELVEPSGEGWAQVIELVIALVLSSAIGIERELRQKSAGLRTHALVGIGAALFMLISKYGFTDVLHRGTVVVDPSRVAAQIVTGIGFIGAGLIFVRSEFVRGLTTAAVVWVTAAVGAACGAGLPILAAIVTVGHFLVVRGYPRLLATVGINQHRVSTLEISYQDGRGLLRSILAAVTSRGFVVSEIATRVPRQQAEHDARVVGVALQLRGARPLQELTEAVSAIDGVTSVRAGTELDEAE